MVQVNRTAEDVASMESELYHLRRDKVELERKLTIAETQLTAFKIENALLSQKADDRLSKMTRVETMVTGLASSLFAQLKEIREEREVEQAIRRRVQEDRLDVGSQTKPAPEFLQQQTTAEDLRRNPNPREQTRRPTAEEDAQSEREEQELREAAERIASPPPIIRPAPPAMRPSPRPAQIDHTIADRDRRLPDMGEYRPTQPPRSRAEYDEDQKNLRDLANRMG